MPSSRRLPRPLSDSRRVETKKHCMCSHAVQPSDSIGKLNILRQIVQTHAVKPCQRNKAVQRNLADAALVFGVVLLCRSQQGGGLLLLYFRPARATPYFSAYFIRESLNKSPAAVVGSFSSAFRFEKLEIHKVFLRFSNLNPPKNLSTSALADLIRASLGIDDTSCPVLYFYS